MKKVLVVDDSMVARKMVIQSFPEGWEVDVAQVASILVLAQAIDRLLEGL